MLNYDVILSLSCRVSGGNLCVWTGFSEKRRQNDLSKRNVSLTVLARKKESFGKIDGEKSQKIENF